MQDAHMDYEVMKARMDTTERELAALRLQLEESELNLTRVGEQRDEARNEAEAWHSEADRKADEADRERRAKDLARQQLREAEARAERAEVELGVTSPSVEAGTLEAERWQRCCTMLVMSIVLAGKGDRLARDAAGHELGWRLVQHAIALASRPVDDWPAARCSARLAKHLFRGESIDDETGTRLAGGVDI